MTRVGCGYSQTMLSEPARFCSVHHPPGYVNIYSNRCQFRDCTRQASYGEGKTSKAVACSKHKDSFGCGKMVQTPSPNVAGA